jgi:hypothetical protein
MVENPRRGPDLGAPCARTGRERRYVAGVDASGSNGDEIPAGVCDTRSSNGSTPTRPPHLGCPYCCSYEVDRLYVGSARVDSCSCRACGADWDEVVGSGEIKGRSKRHSALLHH